MLSFKALTVLLYHRVRHRRSTPIYLSWLRLHSRYPSGIPATLVMCWLLPSLTVLLYHRVRHRRTTPIYLSWLRLHSRYPSGIPATLVMCWLLPSLTVLLYHRVRHRRTTPIYLSWLRLHSRYPNSIGYGTSQHPSYLLSWHRQSLTVSQCLRVQH